MELKKIVSDQAIQAKNEDNPIIHKFIRILMKDGKKYIAIKIIKHSIQHLGIPAILTAIENVKPFLEVRPIRIAGTTYQVPYEIKESRQLYLAIKWLILGSKSRNEKTMAQKLLAELTAAVKKQGFAIKKKEEFHKLAEANRAFSNFRWMP